MESIHKAFAAIADWYLDDLSVWAVTHDALRRCLISLFRGQTTLE
jgi:hypothetical protein